MFCYLREDIQKKNCRFGENGTIGGGGVRKIIEFSSFTNDEKHRRGGGKSHRVTIYHIKEPKYHIEYYLMMKYAWDETAWDETC